MDYSTLPDEALVPAQKARRDFWGGIGETTEWRWAQSVPDFPKPRKIHGRKYYRLGDLRTFNRAQEAETAA